MDIVFVLLLLFGGFALGSVTAERALAVHNSTSVAEVRSQEPPVLTTSRSTHLLVAAKPRLSTVI